MERSFIEHAAAALAQQAEAARAPAGPAMQRAPPPLQEAVATVAPPSLSCGH